MKKIISLILSLAIVIGVLPMIVMAEDTATTGWDGTTTEAVTGSGTSADPYKIANAQQLAYVRDWVNAGTNRDKYYELTADIDLNNQEWIPIGLDYDKNTNFKGTFDGNGYAVKNIKITTYRSYNGLFGDVFSATIKELGVENMNIEVSGGGGSHGAMAGRATATFTDCYVKNSSVRNVDTGEKYEAVGGFLGRIRTTSTFTNCYVYNTTITGTYRSSQGGFFGISQNTNASTLTNCYTAKLTFQPLVEGNGAAYYGFGRLKEDADGVSTVNCWSTVLGKAGRSESNSGFVYKPEWVLGNEGATKQGIVAALVDNGDGTFVVDPEINDGYPCFGSERNFAPATEFAGGSGTDTDPYIIASAAQLALVAEKVNGGGVWTSAHYKLDRDIDFGNMEWTPIGNGTYTFGGTFDGDGHVIRNLYISELTTKYVGLFGSVLGGTIENVGIENMTVALKTQTDAWQSVLVGGMVGYLYGTVRNSYIKNSSIKMVHMGSGYGNVGSFVGSLRRPATIENCYTYNVGIHGDRRSNQGGFLGTGGGNSYASTITNCYTNAYLDCEGVYQTGYLEAPFYAFAKDQEVYTTFTDCYSTLTDEPGDTDTATGYNYNEANSAGTLGASKSTITDALVVSGGSFKTDSSINDGFPSLWFEEAPQEEKYVMAAILPGDNVKVTLVEKVADANAKMYIASYAADGRMIDAETAQIADTLTFTTNVSSKDADHIKVFVWDNNLQAISKMYKGIVDFDTMIHVLPLDDGVTEEDVPSYGRKTRLVMMGDSIMDSVLNTSGSQWNKTGWEKHIGTYLNDDITVIRHGHSGYTIQHFMNGQSSYHYCSWEDIKEQFGEGDYVILSLGANDNSRLAGTHATESFTEEYFIESYKKVIAEAEAKGAKVIICTPIPTNGNYNSATGRFVSDSIFPTSRAAIAKVVEETGVECIDLSVLYTAKLNELIEAGIYTGDQMRITKTNGTITAPGVIYVDDTHTSDYGSKLLAEVVAKAIAENSTTGLEDFVVLGE